MLSAALLNRVNGDIAIWEFSVKRGLSLGSVILALGRGCVLVCVSSGVITVGCVMIGVWWLCVSIPVDKSVDMSVGVLLGVK